MHRFLCFTFLLVCCVMITGCEPMPTATNTPAAAPPAQTAAESVKAQVGVGAKGRSLDGETGVGKMVSAPVSAFFAVKERVAFDIQVPQALNLFRASEGRLPKSHQEFMEKIVKANNIKLPELPAGMTYRFNPELGELWVDPPAGNAATGAATGPATGSPTSPGTNQ